MTQLEFIQLANALALENPESKIHTFVDSEECGEYHYTEQEIKKVEHSFWCVSPDGERIFTDKDSILDHLCAYVCMSEDDAEKYVDQHEEKAIVIWTGAV